MAEHPVAPGPVDDRRPFAAADGAASAQGGDPTGLDSYWSTITDPQPIDPALGLRPVLPGLDDNPALERALAEVAIDRIREIGGVGAGFLIDPDRANTAIGTLQEVIDKLTETLLLSNVRGVFLPAGHDHVSLRVAANCELMADNAVSYVRVLREQVIAVRDALRTQVQAYQRADAPDVFRRA